jgi:serine protease AprX
MRIGVAVADTGIYRHRDFGNRIVGFVDFVNGKKQPYDDSGHGSHVSGIIAGNGAASGGKYRGLAPSAALIGVKVLDSSGNGRISNVVSGVKWILYNRKKYNIRVVNISFGMTADNCDGDEKTLVDTVEELWDSGIVVVAAAGNSGPDRNSITAPGISRKIITVGAYDDTRFSDTSGRHVRYYSGRGPTSECVVKPEVVVTGSNIVACSNRRDSYSQKSGTSMSAPIVSGAVAAFLAVNPDFTPKQVKLHLKECCEKIDIPDNQQGWGLLNIVKFLTNIE